jgi:hypothetical protein
MILHDILTLPSFYKDRHDKVMAVSITNVLVDGSFTCSCISNNKYQTKIQFIEGEIKSNSKILVDCQCASFNFEFMNSIFRSDGLLYVNRHMNLPAKNKNKYTHLSGCKHLIKFAQFLFHKSNIYNQEFKKNNKGDF